MNNTVTDLFAIPIYEAEFKNFDTMHTNLMEYITESLNKAPSTNYDGHEHPIADGKIYKIYDKSSNDTQLNKYHNSSIKQLAEWIEDHCNEYWKVLNYSDLLKPYIIQMWAGIQTKGSRTVSHNHNPIPIGGVFYLEAKPEQGNLLLENPLDLLIGKTPTNANNNHTPNRLYHEVETYTGKLVLFPGWMKHFTKGNPIDQERIAIAINFGCSGQVHFTEFG